MLVEKKLLKSEEVKGDNGIVVLMDAVNRVTNSLYILADNNTTIDENLAMQLWEVEWTGTNYPSKKVNRDKILGKPNGLLLLKATENGVPYSMINPAWSFENETINITDITNISSNNDYTATFLIL